MLNLTMRTSIIFFKMLRNHSLLERILVLHVVEDVTGLKLKTVCKLDEL